MGSRLPHYYTITAQAVSLSFPFLFPHLSRLPQLKRDINDYDMNEQEEEKSNNGQYRMILKGEIPFPHERRCGSLSHRYDDCTILLRHKDLQ